MRAWWVVLVPLMFGCRSHAYVRNISVAGSQLLVEKCPLEPEPTCVTATYEIPQPTAVQP